MQKVYCRERANIPVWRASPGDSASPVIRNRRHAEDEARGRRFLTHEGLALSTLKIRPAGLAVVNRRAGEHVDCLDCGDRHRPGREHANRGQLTLAGARVGGKRQDNLSCAVTTTDGALATLTLLKNCYRTYLTNQSSWPNKGQSKPKPFGQRVGQRVEHG